MSKGSGRRPAAISAVEAERNWARTFGKGPQLAGNGAPNHDDRQRIPTVLDGGLMAAKGFYDDHAISPTEGA